MPLRSLTIRVEKESVREWTAKARVEGRTLSNWIRYTLDGAAGLGVSEKQGGRHVSTAAQRSEDTEQESPNEPQFGDRELVDFED